MKGSGAFFGLASFVAGNVSAKKTPNPVFGYITARSRSLPSPWASGALG